MSALIRHLIFVPAALQEQANVFALKTVPQSGQTFTVPLYSKDQSPQTVPSYYWSSFGVDDATDQIIKDSVSLFPGGLDFTYDLREDPTFPFRKLAELNLATKQTLP